VGNAGVSPTPAITFSDDTLQNGADAVALYAGDGSDFPNDTNITTEGLIDAIVYDANDGDDGGLLTLLNADEPQVNEDGNDDMLRHSNQRCPNGNGGQRNTSTYIQAFPTPGGLNDCAPQSCTVNISVQLQGSSRPDPAGWAIPVTVTIDDTEYHCDTAKADDEDKAICQIDELTPGTYTITIISDTTLQNIRENVVISAGDNAVDMGTLLEGDANQDGIINISDFGILAVAFMKSYGEDGYDPQADFDRNGIVNISDFGLLAVNFMQTSPIQVEP